MADTRLIQIEFKVDNEDYKDYERALDNFLNSFNNYDYMTTETDVDVEHPIYRLSVQAVDNDGKHTLTYTIRESGDTCDLYSYDMVDDDNLYQENISLQQGDDEIIYLINEDIADKGYTTHTIDKIAEDGTTERIFDIDDHI